MNIQNDRKYLTEEELKRLLRVIKSPRDKAIFALGLERAPAHQRSACSLWARLGSLQRRFSAEGVDGRGISTLADVS
jgi:hypothetical protein